MAKELKEIEVVAETAFVVQTKFVLDKTYSVGSVILLSDKKIIDVLTKNKMIK